jgi:hypothetical protein
MQNLEFQKFPKIPRLSRECIITEKIDGTCGVIAISEDGEFAVGSKNRWITPEDDNFGFAKWAYANKADLMTLGPGYHYGEWWGQGIQRSYGLKEKRFSLFNVSRWVDERPACCHCVPVLCSGIFSTQSIQEVMEDLELSGSAASPGFMNPEGVIVYHTALRGYFKKTIKKDEYHKGEL